MRLLTSSLKPILPFQSCSYNYDDMDWGQVCPTSYCDSASQSPVAINTTDVQTCNGHLQLSSGYGGKLKGHFEREGHRLQFAIDNWATDGPTVTHSHSMHNTEYRKVYKNGAVLCI